VTLPRNPLRFNVGFLLKTPVGTYRDIHFEYPEILLKPDFRLSDFSGVAKVSRTPQGILVQGDFQGKVPAECVRCLNDFVQLLHASFDELFALDERSITESELLLPEDGTIDLEPLVREYLLIEVPISPVCKNDCLGLCPECGQNLNELPRDHHHQEEE
jgi:uncharacterized protein